MQQIRIYASGVGFGFRRQYLQLTERQPLPEDAQRKARLGAALHTTCPAWFEEAHPGLEITDREKKLEHPLPGFGADAVVVGKIDGLVVETDTRKLVAVYEAKTMGDGPWWSALRDGIPDYFVAQAQTYMGMLGGYPNKVVWHLINRETGADVVLETPFDSSAWMLIQTRCETLARYVADNKSMPAPCFESAKHTYCQHCEYSEICWLQEADPVPTNTTPYNFDLSATGALDWAEAVATYVEGKKLETEGKSLQDAGRSAMKELMAEMNCQRATGGGAKSVTWSCSTTSRVDITRMKTEEPATYARFLKDSTSDSLRVTLEKP